MAKFVFEAALLAITLASLTQAQNRPALGSVPYGTPIVTCTTPGTVALTYDDGPGPFTAELLDTLASNGIKATFFILGDRNNTGPIDQTYPALIQRMFNEGHQIASHSWDHQSLESLSSAQRIIEMTQNEAAFSKILGFFPTYMRPPYGFCYGPSGCLSDMGKLGYHVINWNVDTKDYENDSPTLIQTAKNNWDAAFLSASSSSSFIPLTHDIHINTVENLAPYMIKEIKQRGFKFATVGQCLGDPASNWYRDAKTYGAVVARVIGQSAVNTTTTSASITTSSAAAMQPVTKPSPTIASSSSIASATATTTTKSASTRLTIHTILSAFMVSFYMLLTI